MIFLLLFSFPIGHIKTLMDNYVNLQIQSIEMKENANTVLESIDASICSSSPFDYKEVPVALPKKAGTVYAKVSDEDYDKVIKASTKWRLCSSGYPIFVKRNNTQFETTYMHKIVFGDTAKHLNGDRLDNRRCNLIQSSKKRKSDDNDDRMFTIKTPIMVSEELHNFKSIDKDLNLINGYANIDYHGNKTFNGIVKKGIPHGFGVLYEKKIHTQSMGNWIDGKMIKGLVIEFKPLPSCMCPTWKTCPFREVSKIDVVQNGHRM